MTQDHMSIKAWSEEDRPREKLASKGRAALSNSELIAILLGSGSKDETAVSLAQRLLSTVHNDLNSLGKLELQEFMTFKGIGPAKALTLIAGLELGRRRKAESIDRKPIIQSSNDVYQRIFQKFEDLKHEEFWVIFLKNNGSIIKEECISRGGVNATIVDPRIIFQKAVQLLAVKIILIHNHPSGSLKPSSSDIRLTEKICNAGKVLDITVNDHLIVSEEGYYSFMDEGLIQYY
ncbi:MAG: DNA repair protein RadC [Saprospiraceae bacterium]|nr:DNA repair protein RadC [Saprospiraceae bacterium]|tara:strand:+ start:1820 stop:2521 length:702 start_codon:yes stop_codon:yes gene_type:complete